MGQHITDLSSHTFEIADIWLWASIWMYYAALCFTKVSILLQYLRIFPHERFRKSCYAVMAIVVVWSCWAVFSAVFMCRPISYFWSSVVVDSDPHCLPRLTVW